jgi:hypothetical protein
MTFRHSKEEHWRRWVEQELGDYALNVSKGLVPGTSWVNKFGRNIDVASGATEEIWDGSAVYSFPATALMTYVSQKVDQAAMQGETVEIQGLDASWNLVVQSINLDGTDTTTPVILTTALIRCFRIKVLADVVTDQIITVHNTANNQDYAYITAGNNQTSMAIYTVPAGKTAYMTNYYATHNPKTGNNFTANSIRLWAKDNANGYEKQLKHDHGIAEDGFFQHQFEPYQKFTEKTDVYLTSNPTGAAADISAGFDLYLVDN